jgi:ABC-type Na+ efflux pump permease subunit
MGKIWIVAHREYVAIVGTKAFLLAITIMPVLMFGGIVIQSLLRERTGPAERKIAVADGTGLLFQALLQAAERRNEKDIFDKNNGKQIKPRYVLEAGRQSPLSDDDRYELSQRVRRREIDAFVEIPAAVADASAQTPKVAFHAENATVADEKNWLQGVINDILRTRRLQQAGIDPQVVQRAGAPFIPVEPLGLVDRSAAGQVTKAQESNLVDALFIPFGVMLLMWMVIFLAAQPMMESVLEEKSQSIAEVLLGSVDTFQLLLGKLLGGVAGSLSVMAIYGLGAIGYAWHADYLHLVPLRVLPWFLVYQVLAVMLFGSVFMAVGSAVTQLKEAQSMLLPVWMVMMIPLFVWLQVVREPLGPLATWLSFFPPATPLVMVLRSAATASVPWWQQALGILVLLATTLLVVFLAARIFRIGFLARGKTPKLTELLRWALHG